MQRARRWALIVPAVVGALMLVAFPLVVDDSFWQNLLILVFLNVLLGGAWNLLGGYTGQISFGHAAFFGIGAYTSTILLLRYHVSPWIGMWLGGVLAAVLASALGWLTFRLRGPYFALATLAVAEVLRVIVFNWDKLTGGGDGLNILGWLPGRTTSYYAALALATGGTAVIFLVVRKLGILLESIREDHDAAEALGVPALRLKLFALIVSAFLVALGGSFFASYSLYINPELVFETTISIQMIFVCVVGGIGTLWGPVLGAIVLVPLSEYFRGFSPVANVLIYGVFIVGIMLFMPEGLLSGLRRWRGFRLAPARS